ncbi:uncharacterized protein [Chelonus insularis]|uniref:uncharacterized protein n=1 Tax=Chelonus insularis TaxID=460826 RepID=UPI001589C8A4|nr:uncharacterized protein LOC118064418 [Chelonus insularis]
MVCDQAQTNCSVFKSLGISLDKFYYEWNDERIYCGYDSPHMWKCFRNLLYKHDFILNGEIISWGAIRELFDIEKYNVARAYHKLTSRHLDPGPMEKMSVKLATQVFSHTVASDLKAGYCTGELKHPACKATVEFIERMNCIIDCMNAKSICDNNMYRAGLCKLRDFVERYLISSCEWLSSLSLANAAKAPPSFTNMIITINSTLELWKELQNRNVEYLMTANLQQDPLENLFGYWRGSCGNNSNPSAKRVMSCAQRSMVYNVGKAPEGANCEEDKNELLLKNTSIDTPVELNDNNRFIVANSDVICSDMLCDNEVFNDTKRDEL